MKRSSLAARNVLLVLAAVLLCDGAPAENRLPEWCGRTLEAEDSRVVTLTGTIVRETHWGPPGFGENPATDSRFSVWVLKLDFRVPVTVQDYPQLGQATRMEATRMRIIPGLNGNLPSEEFLNRHVAVDGTLWSASAPADVTPIIMQATQIRISGPSRCDGTDAPPKI